MDEKIRSVLENEELMSKIAAAVGGAGRPGAQSAGLPYADTQPAGRGAEAMALLAALKPFLREERRQKLDTVTRALAVASVYKNVKNA